MSIRVRILRPMDGMRNGLPYPPVGEVMELTEGDTGIDLVRNGNAELVKAAPVVETAVVAPPETTAKRTGKPAARKR